MRFRLLSLVPTKLSKKQQDLINLNSGPIEVLHKYFINLNGDYNQIIRDREMAVDLELNSVAGEAFAILNEAFSWNNLSVQRITSDSHDQSVLEFIAFKDRARPLTRMEDFYKRIKGPDSRCYCVFNPHLHYPVCFVYLKLGSGLISKLSDVDRPPPSPPTSKDSCIFYSISSPFRGLKGIEFGGRLLKAVMSLVAEENEAIKIFATFSPIPNFREWLVKSGAEYSHLTDIPRDRIEEFKDELIEACRIYLNTKIDPVTKFHLRNGASIGPLRFLGDADNENSFKQSYGIQVNYIYSGLSG